MEDYIVREYNNRQAYGALTGVATMIKNWKARRQMRKLLAMIDHHLKDIGLTRHQLSEAIAKPLTLNWDYELEREARLQSRASQNRCFSPLSKFGEGQILPNRYLPDVMWVPSELNFENTLTPNPGIVTASAIPMIVAMSVYSIAVAAS